MGWDLITKLNLWLLLSTLPVVIQTGLISHIPECCPCSPSAETYLAPGDFTLLQPAVSSSSGRWLFQNKSPTFSGHLHYSSFQALTSLCGTSNSQARIWKQLWQLKANLALKFNGLILLPVCTSRQSLIRPRGQLTEVVGSKTCLSICHAQRVERLLCSWSSQGDPGSCCLWESQSSSLPLAVMGTMPGHLCVEPERRELKDSSHFLLRCLGLN